jgi:3-hydroxyisobutyrate dehydrogenase
MNIGFIGLGRMGNGMAANILKAGYPLTVHDLRREAAEPFLESGASWADTPKDVAKSSDIIFTSLPGPQDVEAVALGEGGIIEGIRPGSVYIDLSTNSPELVRRIYRVFKEKGADMMDAPVSGGPAGARTGRLTLMMGGDEAVFQKCKPVLDVIGNKVPYTGGIGCGNICKLMHNCIAVGLQVVAAECFTLGVKAGVEPRVLWQTVKEGAVGRGLTFNSLLPSTYFRGSFDEPLFELRLAFKDINLANSLGREYNVPMAIGDVVYQELLTAVNRGWGDKDACKVLLLQEERAGGIEFRIPDAEIE